MSGSKTIRVACGLIGWGLSLTFFGQAALAGPLYFSSTAATTWIDDGSTPGWSGVSGGPYTSAWSNSSDAWFQGPAGTVNVSGTIGAVNSITFATDGYTLNGGTINLTGAGATSPRGRAPTRSGAR